jgi:multidrug efflux pump subunit AcrA (membrane-fusion protein)
MRIRRFLRVLAGIALSAGLAVTAFFTREHWISWAMPEKHAAKAEDEHRPLAEEPKVLKLSPQARGNLGLVAKPIKLQPYWRTIQVPGVVVDRPGLSDRGVTAPAVAVIAKIYAFPGDTVRPGDRLFSLRLISEYLQNTQSELFKATREAQLVKEQKDLLKVPTQSGAIAAVKMIELDNQLRRLNTAMQAYRQDLLTRGLSPAHLESVAEGKFVSEIEVVAPRPSGGEKQLVSTQAVGSSDSPAGANAPAYEVQDLKVELGQQVQAGQTLCLLANHQSLYIEGHSFKREAPFLDQAGQMGWPVRVEFAEDEGGRWPPLNQTFSIHHLANTVDPASRTFAFYLPLTNQSRAYEKDGKTFLVWRFRPGQRVRLHIPVEEFKGAIVLPAGAVAREGPEAYVFQQNGDLFHRRPVRVLYEDRLNVVLANDGSIAPGLYVAQSAAASLNRVLKAQNASGGLPPGFHVHPDGTVHGAH